VGLFFHAALTGDEVRFVGYAFVDDTDLFASLDRSDATGSDVAAALQKSLDLWEGGIRATGGAIELDKSFWYLIDFVWHQGKWTYATIDDCPAELTVLDLKGVRKVLQRLPVSHAERTLGIRIQVFAGTRQKMGRQYSVSSSSTAFGATIDANHYYEDT
jgi:hypothetical protein